MSSRTDAAATAAAPDFRTRGPFVTVLALALVFVIQACGGTERRTGGTTGPGPGAAPPSLTVSVTVDPVDAGLAQALGWSSGVPDAEVRLLRIGEGTWESLLTDQSGSARFEGVLPGTYRLYATRTLTTDEAQDASQPVRAFGDGQTLELSSNGQHVASLQLLADRPSGLVISELGNWIPSNQETGLVGYPEAIYLELYNGSATTQFLDGLTVGASFYTGNTNPTPCIDTRTARTDPAGVYVRQVLQFPGNGASYPIAPGEVKVVAVSAIDHTGVHPGLYDLSGAAFEIRGVASADNPAVPDMLDVGLQPFVTPLGGRSLTPLMKSRRVYVLADAIDPQSMPVLMRDGLGDGFVRVPADLIIDAVSTGTIWPDRDLEFTQCAPTVHPTFDRYEGGFTLFGAPKPRASYQRRILRQDGNTVLQDTDTSAADLVEAPPTPGTLPTAN